MSNVVSFKAVENFNTVTFRSNQWSHDTESSNVSYYRSYYGSDQCDFKVTADHDRGNEPFRSVNFEVFVSGRQSNEHFNMSRKDVIAMRDMFAQIATTMTDDLS